MCILSSKSHTSLSQVGSSTLTSILSRMAVMRGWTRLLNIGYDVRLNQTSPPKLYDIILGHNFFESKEHHLEGGYQQWMDFYMPRAWRVVFAADPLPRVVSMFYFENGFTQTKVNGKGAIVRTKTNDVFQDPKSPKSS